MDEEQLKIIIKSKITGEIYLHHLMSNKDIVLYE